MRDTTWQRTIEWLWVRCRSCSAKELLITGLFCGKQPVKIRHCICIKRVMYDWHVRLMHIWNDMFDYVSTTRMRFFIMACYSYVTQMNIHMWSFICYYSYVIIHMCVMHMWHIWAGVDMNELVIPMEHLIMHEACHIWIAISFMSTPAQSSVIQIQNVPSLWFRFDGTRRTKEKNQTEKRYISNKTTKKTHQTRTQYERWGAGVEYHFQEISWNLRPVVNGT